MSAVVTVGSGVDCDYSDLQTAIDDSGDFTEIRLENETFSGNFSVVSKNGLFIRGGFDTCSDVAPSSSSVLDAAGSGRPLEVRASTDIEIADLFLQNGSVAASPGGGGLYVRNSEMTLETVTVRLNETTRSGGGIYLEASGGNPQLRIDGGSVITFNNANGSGSEGGGIACNGVAGQQGVITIPDADIFANTSTSEGGGILVRDCALFLGNGARVLSNATDSVGGGIAALGQSTVVGDPGGGLSISDNTAGDASSGLGGAIFAGDTAQVEIAEATVDSNEAYSGGAFYVKDSASLEMDRSEFPDCTQPTCSVLSRNFAYQKGGALAIESASASAQIRQTLIYGNSADGNASIGFLDGGTVDIEGSVIYENAGDDLFEIRGPSALQMAWSTLADNTPDPDSASSRLVSWLTDDVDASSVKLYSNIIRDAGGRDVLFINDGLGTNYTTDFDCLISHELDSLDGATRSVVADPQFLDPANDDYHVADSSPAVDACDDSYPPVAGDIDGDTRGRDIGVASALDYDIGADEVWFGIFADRFEQ